MILLPLGRTNKFVLRSLTRKIHERMPPPKKIHNPYYQAIAALSILETIFSNDSYGKW